MERLRIGVLFNDDGALAAGAAEDAAAVAAAVGAAEAAADSCRALGWEAVLLPAPEQPEELAAALLEADVDVWLNLCEGLRGDPRLEAAVAWMLELAGLAYTGAPPRALTLAQDKPVTRAVLAAAGVPIPRGAVLERGDEPLHGLRAERPWIVKPAREDASHGISLQSVVRGEAEARARAREVIATYRQPALVEEFVPGRELNVSLLGEGEALELLPLAEIDYSAFPAGAPRLVTYAAKWLPESEEYRGSPSVPAGPLDPALERAVGDAARAAYRALGLRDYGRVDLRLDPQEGPRVLDVNPNPDLSPDAGLARAAARSGLDHAQLIRSLVQRALARARPSARAR